jgi:uncharacterized protein (TIGR02271 family)
MTPPTHDPLPIEGTPTFADNAWSVRLPVRAEQITISKQVVVRERVRLERRRVEEVARVDAVLRHEELRTTTSGAVAIPEETTETIPTNLAHK